MANKNIHSTITTIVEEDKITTIQLRNHDNTVCIKESIDNDTQEINIPYDVLRTLVYSMGRPCMRV